MDILDYMFYHVMSVDSTTDTENYDLLVTEPLRNRMVAKFRAEVVLCNPPKEPVTEEFCGHPVKVVDGKDEMFWFTERRSL